MQSGSPFLTPINFTTSRSLGMHPGHAPCAQQGNSDHDLPPFKMPPSTSAPTPIGKRRYNKPPPKRQIKYYYRTTHTESVTTPTSPGARIKKRSHPPPTPGPHKQTGNNTPTPASPARKLAYT